MSLNVIYLITHSYSVQNYPTCWAQRCCHQLVFWKRRIDLLSLLLPSCWFFNVSLSFMCLSTSLNYGRAPRIMLLQCNASDVVTHMERQHMFTICKSETVLPHPPCSLSGMFTNVWKWISKCVFHTGLAENLGFPNI